MSVEKAVEYTDRLEAQGVDQVTESHDSLEPHVHKVIESMPWWARVFTQHEGESNA